jgi:hypothetical protein
MLNLRRGGRLEVLLNQLAAAISIWALPDEEIIEHVNINEDPSANHWLFAMMDTLLRDDFA